MVRNSFLYCLQRHVEDFIGFLNPLLGQLTCLAARLAGEAEGATAAPASGAPALLATFSAYPAAVPPFVRWRLWSRL